MAVTEGNVDTQDKVGDDNLTVHNDIDERDGANDGDKGNTQDEISETITISSSSDSDELMNISDNLFPRSTEAKKEDKLVYYHNDLCMPVFSEGDVKPASTKDIVLLLINGKIPTEKIASAPPVYVEHNVSFIVDSSTLGDWRDAKIDLAGMKRSKTKSFYFNRHQKEFIKADKSSYDWMINRYICCHQECKDFHKIVVTATDKQGILFPLIFFQYYFDGEEHEIP